MSAETKLKEELEKSKQQKEEQHQQDPEDAPGLLPPQALLSTPAPALPAEKDSLLSPWWSEQPPQSADEHNLAEDAPCDTVEPTETVLEQAPEIPSDSQNNQSSVVNVSVLGFSRSSPKESQLKWKERCMLLSFTEVDKREQAVRTSEKKDAQKELFEIMDRSKDCSMVCFLKTNRAFSKTATPSLNPFSGLFISVAKSPKRCKEHLLDASYITSKKNFSDYYTMELGQELSHSGEHVTKAIQNTFGPLQRLTELYVNSWKDGTQQAFFSKFWSSIQKGDAFYLVKDSTKRLFENALGHDKKPSDKK